MANIGIPVPPSWVAFPPEINTSRLQAGAGAVPMLQAAAGWEAFAISLETQADELASSLASLSQNWQGMASERAVTAAMPMVLWLRMLSLQAHKRALQASAQASSWTVAATGTPQLPEIELNHVTNATLHATNFLGVNGIPIALNEADYIRMWNQAAAVMTAYETETVLNTTFEPVAPPKPIAVPPGSEAAFAGAMSGAVPGAGEAVMRNAIISKVSATAKLDTANQIAGRAEGTLRGVVDRAGSHAEKSQTLEQAPQQGMQMGMQMASQLGSTLGQMPQQMMQGVTQPFQQLTQPLQQMSSLFGGMMNGDKGAQIGMVGATPFSNHPAIGGTGPATGSGLVRAASLPGAGGSAPQTPLMSNLVGSGLQPTSPVAVGAGAGPGAGVGLAPVGTGGGMGAGGPMGMFGQRGKSGGNKPGLNAPAPLDHDLGEDEDDEW